MPAKPKSKDRTDHPFAGLFDWKNMREPSNGFKLPTHLDLPESDGKPVENFVENPQGAIISQSIRPLLTTLHPDKQYCIGQNSGIYWLRTPEPLHGVIVPDWFYVPDVPPMLQGQYRRSYVLWQEKKTPFLVLEFVSDTGHRERDDTEMQGKFWIYENAVKAQYYGIFDPLREILELYVRRKGKFKSVPENEHGRYPIPDLNVEFGIWHGEYERINTAWMRLWDDKGNLLLHDQEKLKIERRETREQKKRANKEKQRAQQEKQRADDERSRADRLAEKLREMGIDPVDL